MNIKKFEARTMKEALQLVKSQLGPDAVILSAKEVSKGFAMSGQKMIEITAAYSESMLKQKEFVKSKMLLPQQQQFSNSSARDQREVIKKVMEDQLVRTQKAQAAKSVRLYGPPLVREPTTINQRPVNYSNNVVRSSRKYIDIDAELLPKTAAMPVPAAQSTKNEAAVLTEQAKNAWQNMDVQNLKTEIEQLKEIILDFKAMPQNFVQSHPGAEFGVNYSMCSYYQRLTARGLLPEVASDVILAVQENLKAVDLKKENYIESLVARYIMDTTLIQNTVQKKFQLFVGASAAGKSTSMIKMAYDLIHRDHKKVAIISTDTIKIGADEQMKVYSQMLNIPFVSVRSPMDWEKIVPYLNHVDHVLVDFASLSLRNQDEINYIQQIRPPINTDVQTHLVLSARGKDQDIIEIANKYRHIGYDDLIFTSLDESTNYGIIYNTVRKLNKPLFGFGIGPKIPEDFEYATVERVLDLILEITKKTSTMEQSL